MFHFLPGPFISIVTSSSITQSAVTDCLGWWSQHKMNEKQSERERKINHMCVHFNQSITYFIKAILQQQLSQSAIQITSLKPHREINAVQDV
jgi:hypothetical protein